MKRWGKLKPVRFDEKELKTDLETGNFIFVGSSCDMWAENIPDWWIENTLIHCAKFDNKYLFQTKNPERILSFKLPLNSVVCTTIETNRYYPEIMGNCVNTFQRSLAMSKLQFAGIKTYVTIEPIIDFDLEEMISTIRRCNPRQVNIGADSCNHKLPEPSAEKVSMLIKELEKFTVIARKTNLKRLLK
jgi:DNA repair photolyase